MTAPRTLLDKLWTGHEVLRSPEGVSLLWVDRHLVHEGSHHAFAKLAARRCPVAEPGLTFAMVDHYAPSQRSAPIADPTIPLMINRLRDNACAHGIRLFDLDDADQGIAHVVSPEQGLSLPGLLINCGDSHTSTHGALGALAFGIGATDVAHVLATQTLWYRKPKSLRVTVDGPLGRGVSAKDIALNWIAQCGTDGAQGHAVEFAGDAVRGLSMEGRMTLCNLSIEGGGRAGMIAPDQTTFAYVAGRPFAPKGADWDAALRDWADLHSDADAAFDQEVTLDGAAIAPVVTWGTNPQQSIPITGIIPVPGDLPPTQAQAARSALDYMGLTPGRPIEGTPVDQVFIGSCTNGRIEDLRAAASVLRGRQTKVPGLVSPGSGLVKAQAEAEGLAQVFTQAGLTWAAAGCSLCVGMNGDLVGAGKRCASSTNRNFRGRQGRGARTHLMSPVMVAAAAVTGTLTDARALLEGRM